LIESVLFKFDISNSKKQSINYRGINQEVYYEELSRILHNSLTQKTR